jgi:8-oxo-dGTP pyrophosphatase MutT (NUDIX family)
LTPLPLPLELATIVERLRSRPYATADADGAAAAVASIFRQGPAGPEILFIERATREGDPWSGHIAFPGGKRDPADASLLATAVRETHEEVGLRLPDASLVVRFDDFFAYTNGYQVAQFVFALDGDGGALVPNREVAGLMWTPLSVLVAPENASTFVFERDDVRMELPSVRLGEHVLWGMTHRMTQALLEAVASAGSR